MVILILEGIATSGKTAVKDELGKALKEKGLKLSVIGEEETLMPILDNAEKGVSIDHLKKIINAALESAKRKDVLIFDRLFFTHVFRTQSDIKDFEEIEKMFKGNVLLAFLKIDENKISQRISSAMKHRPKEWGDYVKKKGTMVEIFQYYKHQQRLLLDLLKKTSIPHRVYNSTNMDFKGIKNKILKAVLVNSKKSNI